MKPSRWLALAAAFAGCAVAYGIHIFGRQDESRPAVAATVKSKGATGERSRSSFKPASESATVGRARSESPSSVAVEESRKVIGSPALVRGNVLSESQWRENATRVEMEANHELNRLTALLDLDPVQQEGVFSALAQKSPYWLPGMQTGSGNSGVTTGTPGRASAINKPGKSDSLKLVQGRQTGGNGVSSTASSQQTPADLTAYLNADQQQSLIEDAMNREEWWAEVLPQLLPPTITETANSTPTTETTDTPAETKVFDGTDVLIVE